MSSHRRWRAWIPLLSLHHNYLPGYPFTGKWHHITKTDHQGCHVKHLNISGLNSRNLLTVQEARSQRSPCQQGQAPSEDVREGYTPAFSPNFQKFPGLYMQHSRLHAILMACVYICISPFHKDARHVGLETYPSTLQPHLSWLYMQSLHFQIRSHLIAPEGNVSVCLNNAP